MSAKQWGNGFHSGKQEGYGTGYDEGYESGMQVPSMMEAEQINVLIGTLATLISQANYGSEIWATLRTLSEVNSKNLLTAERAWHNTYGAGSRSRLSSINSRK